MEALHNYWRKHPVVHSATMVVGILAGLLVLYSMWTYTRDLVAERATVRSEERAAIQACVNDGGQWVKGECFTPNK
ncbi:hypothetical protein D2T29_12430 [Sinirhodobacter populi]|uniref:Uncharacterized protein n=1 Tax=Paenirhodobacter populi TaxID=2306993 RepID=A0A443KCE4_9RHOB|nr:hypothetical protein [Sinirhodobacter populi]RWR30471.1 hypothetical protein D2T29_12430 [Sinirhodobacter populi]